MNFNSKPIKTFKNQRTYFLRLCKLYHVPGRGMMTGRAYLEHIKNSLIASTGEDHVIMEDIGEYYAVFKKPNVLSLAIPEKGFERLHEVNFTSSDKAAAV